MSNQQTKKATQPATPAFDPWLLWVAFRRHWAWVLSAGTVLAVVGAAAILLAFEPEYEATHILQANRNYVLSKDTVASAKDLAKSDRVIIMSPEVLGDVLADPTLTKVPSLADAATRDAEMRRRLRISNSGSEDIVAIAYRDTDRNEVHKVANAVADEYIKERRLYDERQLRELEKSLRQPIDQARRNVDDARKEYEGVFKKVYGKSPFSSSPDSLGGESLLNQDRRSLGNLDLREISLNSALVTKQGELSQATYQTFSDEEIRGFVNSDDVVQKLQAKIRGNEDEIRNYEQREVELLKADRLKTLRREISSWEKELENQKKLMQSKAEEVLRRRAVQRLTQEIKGIELQIGDLKAQRDAVSAQIEEETTRLEKSGVETTELAFAKQKLEDEQEFLKRLNERYLSLRVEMGRGSSVTSRSQALPPTQAIEEKPIKKMAVVAMGAFMIPFLLAVLLEFKANRITKSDSIDANQLIPILGEIARIPSSQKRSTGHHLYEESIDALRANLLFKVENIRTLAVTSSVSGEGKSSVTFQLASSIARCTDEKVLVIDADLRNPHQHDLFGLELGPGLCKLLNGEALFDTCIDSSDDERVHLLSAGRLDCNPHNLLTRSKLNFVLEQATSRYRYVIVDTAPVLPAAETLTITSVCDATLLCAMRDVSQTQHVKRTFQRLSETGSNIIGAAFSGVPTRIYAARYGDYRYAQE